MFSSKISKHQLQNNQTVRAYLLITTLILLLGWILFVHNDTAIQKLDTQQLPESRLDEGYAAYLENVSSVSGRVAVTGWFLRQGEEIRNVTLRIVLKNTRTGQYFVIPTSMQLREDVTAYFADGHDYDHCGFTAAIPYGTAVNPDADDYALYVWYTLNGDSRLISLETTLQTWGSQDGLD